MVSIKFIALIVIPLVVLQAIESFALNSEDKELAKKKAIGYGDQLRGRKMMMMLKMKTHKAKESRAEELNGLKSSEIGDASAYTKSTRSNKKHHHRRGKKRLRALSSKWNKLRDSHPSKSMSGLKSLTADYHHPDSHPPRHN